MFRKIIDRLFSVKSIVTLTMTGAFIYCIVCRLEIPQFFQTIFTMIIGFYFGTQAEKRTMQEPDDEPSASELVRALSDVTGVDVGVFRNALYAAQDTAEGGKTEE